MYLYFSPVVLAILFLVSLLTNFSSKTLDYNTFRNEYRAQLLTFKEKRAGANYDVIFQRLEFKVDPSIYFINGKVTTHFKALSPINQITLELATRLIVEGVETRQQALSFTHQNNLLVINLPATLTAGRIDSVSITYSGQPPRGEEAFTTTVIRGNPVLYSLSQPYGARDWWPSKQSLEDKIDSIDVIITAPERYTAVSNGVRITKTVNNGLETTKFQHRYPIPAYLVAIAVAEYKVYSYTGGTGADTFPIINYVYPWNYDLARQQTPITLHIMNLFETLFGPYPYRSEQYGHAQFGWGGGMEHATISFMGSFSEGLIAHEMAHQWFGNMVTCATLNDIWLNEGFATYAEALYAESVSNTTFRNVKRRMVNNITSQPGGSVFIHAHEPLTVERVFDSRLSYQKGGMVVHMLRQKVGDVNFFKGIRNYLNDPRLKWGYATTADLKRHLEEVSKTDLTTFFNNWVFGEGFPQFQISWHQKAHNLLTIKVQQNTSMPSSVSFFETPINLRIEHQNNPLLNKNVTLFNNRNNQVFTVPVNDAVINVIFDPEFDIISANNIVKTSLEENLPGAGIVLYPIPAGDFVFIDKPDSLIILKISIYDMAARVQISTVKGPSFLDIRNLPPGIYAIIFETNFGIYKSRLLKK